MASQSSDQKPLRIEPVYSAEQVNQPVVVYRGPIELTQRKTADPSDVIRRIGLGTVHWSWYPEPGLRFSLQHPNDITFRYEPVEMSLSGEFQLLEAVVHFSGNVSPDSAVNGTPPIDPDIDLHSTDTSDTQSITTSGVVLTPDEGAGDALHSVAFHVPNLFDYQGQEVLCPRTSTIRPARAVVEIDPWRITMDRFVPLAIMRSLRTGGGHAITHAGYIQRTDGHPFPAVHARMLLDALGWYLSFCAGRWVAPILGAGMDSAGQRVWHDWHRRPVGPWRDVPSWCDRESTQWLRDGLPGFLGLWRDPMTRDLLRRAIRQYVEANSEMPVMLHENFSPAPNELSLQPATIILQCRDLLHTVCWDRFVRRQPLLDPVAYDRLTSADIIRMVLVDAGIPLDVPHSLTHLSTWCKAYHHTSGAETLVEMHRRAICPGDLEERSETIHIMEDAARLALWYVERVLLHLIGYRGAFVNTV